MISSESNTLFPSLFQCLDAFQEEVLLLLFNPLIDGHNDSIVVLKCPTTAEDDWGRYFAPNFLAFWSPVKGGHQVWNVLWIFCEHRQQRHWFCSTGGRLMGRFSSISSNGKKVQQQNI